MNVNIKYEIKAEAFRLSTGFMAPGKDMPAGTNEDEEVRAERNTAWEVWCVANNEIFNTFIKAAEYVGIE